MTAVGEKLRDVHAPARFIDGEIHWQMAAGPDAVDVRIPAAVLHLLGPTPFPAYLDGLEIHRELLCEIATVKFWSEGSSRANCIEINGDDILHLLPGSDVAPPPVAANGNFRSAG